MDEAIALALSWSRSGGVTRPAVDPVDGGHGIAMLPDVACEAEEFVKNDEVLKRRFPARQKALLDPLAKLKGKEWPTQLVESLRILNGSIRTAYVQEAFLEAEAIIRDNPAERHALVRMCGSIVSELRSLGFSDEHLRGAVEQATRSAAGDAATAIPLLSRLVATASRSFTCFVGLSLPAKRPAFPELDSFALVERPPPVLEGQRPLKDGPHLRVTVEARDEHGAAVQAHGRATATIGAATLYLPRSGVEVASPIVGVLTGDKARTFDVHERLPEEDRLAKPSQITRILESSWTASSGIESHSLHDAIRLRDRARNANDPESRLLLLWSALERLTSGARGYDKALSAAKDLVAKTVTLGKLRRDIGDLCAAITDAVPPTAPGRPQLVRIAGGYTDRQGIEQVERAKLLGVLLGPRTGLEELMNVFTGEHPLVSHRCEELWLTFGEGVDATRGKRLSEFHRKSERRVAYQVERIYRARNQVAHVGASPERVQDLAWHAYFYLTQMVAICVHYAESNPKAVAQDVLTERAGRYEAFLKLLETGYPECLRPESLLRPSVVLGGTE